MVANNAFPSATTAGQGLFDGATSVGLIQGQGEPDPSTRFRLTGGFLAQRETLPMWGGVGLYTNVPPITSGPQTPIGPEVGRATALTGGSYPLAGFSTSDQSYNPVSDPANPVGTIGSGQSVNFYPLHSLARIALAADPALISLRGGPMNGNLVSWDFVSQKLVPYTPVYAGATITGAVWASTGGGQTTYTVGTDLTSDLAAGDDIDVSGVVNTGGASTSAFNGNWIVVSVTSTTIVVAAPASGSLGTYASGGAVAGAGGALPCTILRVEPTNCMTVSYDPTTGNATWNYNGAAALIRLT